MAHFHQLKIMLKFDNIQINMWYLKLPESKISNIETKVYTLVNKKDISYHLRDLSVNH